VPMLESVSDSQKTEEKAFGERRTSKIKQKEEKAIDYTTIAKENVLKAMKETIDGLSTKIQAMASYPKKRHPGIPEAKGIVTSFLYPAKADTIRPGICDGLGDEHFLRTPQFGKGIPIFDEAEMMDKKAQPDCSLDEEGKCTYMLDFIQNSPSSHTEPGFPQAMDKFDRTKPVYYAIVLMTAPFRVAKNFPIRKGGERGRKNEQQLVEHGLDDDGNKTWVEYKFDFPKKSFINPEGVSWSDEFDMLHGLSDSKKYHNVKKRVLDGKAGWRPMLRKEEFMMLSANTTRVEFIVAYQRTDAHPDGEWTPPKKSKLRFVGSYVQPLEDTESSAPSESTSDTDEPTAAKEPEPESGDESEDPTEESSKGGRKSRGTVSRGDKVRSRGAKPKQSASMLR